MMNVVILAAGQGKRMHSDLPKVLQPLAGKPMIECVLDTVQKIADVSRTVVVVGHRAEVVKHQQIHPCQTIHIHRLSVVSVHALP